jgi:hypothetical protein
LVAEAQEAALSRQVIVTGYAKMPEGTAVRRLYEQLTLGALVDVETHRVVRATSTLVTEVGQEWLAEQLVGTHLLEEQEAFIDKIERGYWGQARSAIVQSFRDMVRRYERGLARDGGATPDGGDEH